MNQMHFRNQFQAILKMAPQAKLSPKNASGGALLKRPISSGLQDFETNKSLYPLTQPITKLEALAQTTGNKTQNKPFISLKF